MWLFILLFLGVVVYIKFFKSSPLHVIPGPKGSLLVGNAFQLDPKEPHKCLTTWAQEYGGVYKLSLAGSTIVVVSGEKEVQEVLVTRGKAFAGRYKYYRAEILSKAIIYYDYGRELKWQRQLIHSYIRCFGKNKIERALKSKVSILRERIAESAMEVVDVNPMMSNFTVDVIYSLLDANGIATQHDYDLIKRLDRETSDETALGGRGQFLDYFPWLRHFGNETYRKLMKVKFSQDELVDDWIARYKQGDANEGFIQACLDLKDDEKEIYSVDDEVIKGLIWVFILAGTSTTTSSLSALINCLVHHPDVQKKLQQEIDDIIGSEEVPCLADIERLPYHQATLYELLRYITIAPLTPPHKAMMDTQIGDYMIPKGTTVWCNLWALHHDPSLWQEPFEFLPDRFLDESEGLVAADHPNRLHFKAFGAGPRVCPGEVFAFSRMAVCLSSLMQKFTILPATTMQAQPTCDPRACTCSFILDLPAFKVRFQPRS